MQRSYKQVGVLVLALALALPADANEIDFERATVLDAVTTPGAEVTDQYDDLGVTFAHTIALISGLGLNEVAFPPHSGTNVVSDLYAPIDIYFVDTVTFVSGWFTYGVQLRMSALDVGGNTVAQVLSLSTSNLGSNELIGLRVADGFHHLVIAGDAAGGSFTLDDLAFEPLRTNAVPEPGSLLLLAAGLVGLARRRVLPGG